MSGRLACDLSDRIAAVGLVVGTGPEGLSEMCKPGRPVPFLAFNGTKDPLVPYGGGTIPAFVPWKDRGVVISVAELRSNLAEEQRLQHDAERFRAAGRGPERRYARRA